MAQATDQTQEEQHARLLEGLAASIREKGLAQTQVSDIVRHAHASRRTFYKHFPDKEACFVELMNAMSSTILRQVDEAIDRDADIAAQIDQAIDTYLDIVSSDLALTRTFASPSLGERIVIAQREAFERYAALIVSVVESDSKREPDVEPISTRRAYMLVTGLHQTLIRALVQGDDLDEMASEIKAVMKLVLSGRHSA